MRECDSLHLLQHSSHIHNKTLAEAISLSSFHLLRVIYDNRAAKRTIATL